MFTLAISVWPLPVFLGIYNWPNIPVSYAISYFTASLFFHHLTHPQLGVISTLVQPLHSFWSSFSSLPRSMLDTYRPGGGFIFWYHFFSFFVLFMGLRNTEAVFHFPLQWTLDYYHLLKPDLCFEILSICWQIPRVYFNPKPLSQTWDS